MSRDVRVLVVDDSDFFGTLVAGKLSALYEMDIESVTSARAALDALEEEPFDCVVSDYDMPAMNGIELCERLRERDSEVPFILLTAAGSEQVASEAITAGVTDYFPKMDEEDQFEILGQRIRNVVAQRRAEQNLRRQRRLHETLWNVTEDLVHAPTRAEIDRGVARRLADVDRFAFAWVSDGDHESVPRTVAGIDPADLQQVRESLAEADGDTPMIEAVADRATTPATADAPEALAGGTVEVAAVPLLYRDTTYGVLGLGLSADPLVEGEREALDRLGTTVGHALGAVETRREVETFRAAVEQADPAIAITDTDGTIEYVNRAFEEITGYTGDVARGLSLSDLTDWDEKRAAAVRERVRDGEPVREESVQYRADGTQFHADLSLAPITLDGSVEKFVAIESDITDLKSREQRLQVLNRILRHNLRNDLNVIQGHLSLLLDHAEDEDARTHAGKAERKLAELLSISAKVRSADQTIRAAREDDRMPVALDDVLEREAEAVRETYPDATVTVEASDVHARGTNLDVAFGELLENAVEHNDDDPHVEVRVVEDDTAEFVAVEFADDGPGIPDVERSVLERGQETQLEHGRSLGLWLVNWIVTHAGGELDIYDGPDGGTVVRVSLPVAEDEDGPD